MSKYRLLIWNELTSYLAIKGGIILLILLSVVMSLDFIQGERNYLKLDIFSSSTSEHTLEVVYGGWEEDTALNPYPIIKALEKASGVSARYKGEDATFFAKEKDWKVKQVNPPLTYDNNSYAMPNQVIVNEQGLKEWPIKIIKGKSLKSSDFTAKKEDRGLLLNSDFQAYYKVGQTFNLSWLRETKPNDLQMENLPFTIRGFFEKLPETSDTPSPELIVPLFFETLPQNKIIEYDLSHYYFPLEKLDLTAYHLDKVIRDNLAGTGYTRVTVQDKRQYEDSEKIFFKDKAVVLGYESVLFMLFTLLQVMVISALLIRKRMRTYRIFYATGLDKKSLFLGIILAYSFLFIIMLLLLYLLQVYYLQHEWELKSIGIGLGFWVVTYLLIVSMTCMKQLKKERMVIT